MASLTQKEIYAKAVSLFLAELLRTRKMTLNRAAEIAQKVVENINLIDSEEQFLKFVKILTSDFEELFLLHQKISFEESANKRRELEENVRQFVIKNISIDPALASSILQVAVSPESRLEDITAKFPQFKEFMEQKNEPRNN